MAHIQINGSEPENGTKENHFRTCEEISPPFFGVAGWVNRSRLALRREGRQARGRCTLSRASSATAIVGRGRDTGRIMSGGGEKCPNGKGEGVGGGRRGHVCHRKRVSAGCLACVGHLSSRVYHLHYQTTSMLDLDNKPQDPSSCTLRAFENSRILMYRREGVLLAHSDADYSRSILGQTGT